MVNWFDTGDDDHNEQPQKVQRMGHDPLHSAGGEGDKDLQNLWLLLFYIIFF